MRKKATSRKHHQHQKQEQRVVVNVGEFKSKPKRKRRVKKTKEPSREAEEYAESISRIVPRIQYNFPQHSSFNYDAYRSPDLTPPPRPAETLNPISLIAPIPINQRETLSQQLKQPPKMRVMEDPKPQPDLLPLGIPVRSDDFIVPIDKVEHYDDFVEGLNRKSSSTPQVQSEPLYKGLERPSAPSNYELETGRITDVAQPTPKKVGSAPKKPRKPSKAVISRYAEAYELTLPEAERMYLKRVDLNESKHKIRKEVDILLNKRKKALGK